MTTVKIKGMSCNHCVNSVKEALEGVDGITQADVNLEKGEATYGGDVEPEVVKEAISAIGFEVV